MKQITGLLALAATLAVPSLALAQEQTGVYIAPRFIYGFTQMDGMKAGGTHQHLDYDGFSANIGNKTDSAFGGALAVGYNFHQRFLTPVRAELEYAVFSEARGKRNALMRDFEDVNKLFGNAEQRIQAQTLFVNAYYDFHNNTAFTPYLGGGLGLAFLKSKGSFACDQYNVTDGTVEPEQHASFSLGAKTRTNFAWNIGVGFAYDISSNATLDFGYRFTGLGKAEIGPGAGRGTAIEFTDQAFVTAKAKPRNVYMHQVALSLRYRF